MLLFLLVPLFVPSSWTLEFCCSFIQRWSSQRFQVRFIIQVIGFSASVPNIKRQSKSTSDRVSLAHHNRISMSLTAATVHSYVVRRLLQLLVAVRRSSAATLKMSGAAPLRAMSWLTVIWFWSVFMRNIVCHICASSKDIFLSDVSKTCLNQFFFMTRVRKHSLFVTKTTQTKQ